MVVLQNVCPIALGCPLFWNVDLTTVAKRGGSLGQKLSKAVTQDAMLRGTSQDDIWKKMEEISPETDQRCIFFVFASSKARRHLLNLLNTYTEGQHHFLHVHVTIEELSCLAVCW